MKKILTIAGSDCSGGAGIQADIKTITMHGMYAMSAITALTAQNTTGVYGIMNSSADFLKNQIDCIFNDIRPDAVKIGMVSDVEIIEAIAEKALEMEIGARGLRAVMEGLLMNVMYDIPSDRTIDRVTITAGCVEGTEKPQISHRTEPARPADPAS